jgi:hypothetical protein
MADQHVKTRDHGSVIECVSVVENDDKRCGESPRHLDQPEREAVGGSFL